MVIETKEDVVKLSGSLRKNQWITIKAAAQLLLHEHPEGIIVDCSHMSDISGDGAKTFLEAMRDIESAHSRIIVANLPEQVFAVCRSIPGVRSQLPIAASVEDARASLKATARNAQKSLSAQHDVRKGSLLLVPLLENIDLSYGVVLAGRLAVQGKSEIRLIYLMEIARNLPLNAPLLEAENNATKALEEAKLLAASAHVPISEHLDRVRDAFDGILTAAKTYESDTIVIGVSEAPGQEEQAEAVEQLLQMLMKRAPCELVIGRPKPKV